MAVGDDASKVMILMALAKQSLLAICRRVLVDRPLGGHGDGALLAFELCREGLEVVSDLFYSSQCPSPGSTPISIWPTSLSLPR